MLISFVSCFVLIITQFMLVLIDWFYERYILYGYLTNIY